MPERKHWTLEQCKAEAKKFKSRTAFKVQSGSAYAAAYKNGWLDECCSHMVRKKRPDGYWTKRRCAIVAQKYNTRTEFSEKHSSAYTIAKRNDWLNEICEHMLRPGNSTERIIYVFEFADGYAYVGLTWNPEERYYGHLNNKGPVFQHIRDSCSEYEFKLVSEYVDKDAGARLEGEYIASYEAAGWKLLNSKSAGGLGGSRVKWTKERCAEAVAECETRDEIKERFPGAYTAMQRCKWLDELLAHIPMKVPPSPVWTFEICQAKAKKYKHRSDFEKGTPGAYHAAHKKGWIDDICSHMTKKKPAPPKWPKEKCKEAALQCKTKKEFRQKYKGAHYAATKKKWLKEICSHMKPFRRPTGYWTKENCQDAAKECSSRSEFQKKYSRAYAVSKKGGWLDEICAHMVASMKPVGYWTKEMCHKEALKYNTRGGFYQNANVAYSKAHRCKWLDDICAHMDQIKKPNGYWTEERCLEVALQYQTKKDFRASAGNVYAAAHRRRWLDEICAHMKPCRRPTGYWTKERCIEEAAKYNTRSEFQKGSGGAVTVARGYGWFDEIWELTHPDEAE